MLKQCKILLLGLFLFLVIAENFGQNAMLDSLIQLYPTIKEKEKQVDLLNKIGYNFYTVDTEKTLEYAQQGLALAEEINYLGGKGDALNVIAIYHEVNGNVAKSLEINMEVLEIGEETKDDFLVSSSCINIGNKYDVLGEPQKAIKFYQRALPIAERMEHIGNQILVFANLAFLYDGLGENDNAQLYFLKAKKIQDEYPDEPMYCWFYGILGDWYFKNNKIEEAKNCYDNALEESVKRNDKRGIVSLNISLSKLNASMNLYELAEQNIWTAIKVAKRIGDKATTLSTEIGLLDFYIKTNKLEKANDLGYNLLSFAQEYYFTREEMSIYDHLSKVYFLKENYKTGHKLSKEYLRLKDSLFSEERRIEVAEIEEKYQSEIKEKENIALRAKQAEQKILLDSQHQLSIALIAIILLISLVGLLLFIGYKRQKNSREQLEEKVFNRTKELVEINLQLKKSKEELERFTYIASHDLKEPLRNISGFARLLERVLSTTSTTLVQEYISFIKKNTKQMHTLIEDVLEYSKITRKSEKMTFVDLNQTLEKVKKALIILIENKQANVILERDFPDIKGNHSKIYFLFKNLIENGLIYNRAKFPEVRVGYNEERNVKVYYVSDNGIGIDEIYKDKIFEMFKRLHNRDEFEGSGLGLSICKKIVEECGGSIWIDTDKKHGTTFYFTLEPYKKLESDVEIEVAQTVE